MAEFSPVLTLEDLDSLDCGEVVAGYRAGRQGDPDPSVSGLGCTRSFWHGWTRGMMDAGLMPIDEATRQLAGLVVARAQAAAEEFATWPGAGLARLLEVPLQ